jgi:hypothetical protein
VVALGFIKDLTLGSLALYFEYSIWASTPGRRYYYYYYEITLCVRAIHTIGLGFRV